MPVLFRFSGKRYAGNRVTGRTSLLDVPPTLFETLGWEKPPDWQGISVLPHMENQDLPLTSRKLYSELVMDDRSLFALTKWSHKFINTVQDKIKGQQVVQSRQVEAYDLAKDPGETTNLAPGNLPETTQELKQTGNELSKMKEQLHTEGASKAADLDPATIRSLQKIGYLSNGQQAPKAESPPATPLQTRAPSP